MSELERLCLQRTSLSQEDIAQLKEIEKQLPLMAELTGADVFLDCFLNEKTALVLAQARPSQGVSAYEKRIVGQQAVPEREPAVFHAFHVGMPVCDLKAITQENRAVRQNVVPVRNPKNELIAVLIREKDVSWNIRQEQKYEELARSYEEENPSVRAIDAEREQNAVAMREVHHRVKNNLQLVASILNLQARRSDDPNVQKILKENVGRVLSIAAIHDILTHKAEDMQMICSTSLLEQLRRNLQMLVPVNKEIRLMTESDEIFLPTDAATSVSLVITELVTNAIQHAFPDRTEGEVRVSICAGNLYHTVTVSDNGVGFDPSSVRDSSLGLSIVSATVRDKLKGKLRVNSDGQGTKVSFDFRLKRE